VDGAYGRVSSFRRSRGRPWKIDRWLEHGRTAPIPQSIHLQQEDANSNSKTMAFKVGGDLGHCTPEVDEDTIHIIRRRAAPPRQPDDVHLTATIPHAC